MPLPDDANIEPDEFDGGEGDEETSETDWLDITDFGYLIDQIAEKVDGDETHLLLKRMTIERLRFYSAPYKTLTV